MISIRNNLVVSVKRKRAICNINFINSNDRIVNNRQMASYFDNTEYLLKPINDTMQLVGLECGFKCNLKGGGKSAQANSILYGIGKLVKRYMTEQMDKNSEEYKKLNLVLRKNNLLTIDTRIKECKRYGKRGARALKQRSKR